MTLRKLVLGSILITLLSCPLVAQSVRLTQGLEAFSQTDFMIKYHDLKEQSEADMIAFIRNSHKYSPQDIARVQTAYNQTAIRFNRLMENVKNDFLDRKKLKFIAAYPDTYSLGLEGQLRDASNFYAANLQQALADVTYSEQDGSIVLGLIFQLVRYTTQIVSHINQIQREARMFNDQYLNQAIIQPNRFASFDELKRKVEQDPRFQQPVGYNQNPYANSNGNGYQQPNEDFMGSKRTDPEKLKRYFPSQQKNN